MKLRWPWRRRAIANADEAVLVTNTANLHGDELIEVAPGRFVNVAEMLDWPETIRTQSANHTERKDPNGQHA